MEFISDDMDGAATSIFLSHRSKNARVQLQQFENSWQCSALTVIPSMGGLILRKDQNCLTRGIVAQASRIHKRLSYIPETTHPCSAEI
jgi:hypothetical protein